jgi:N-acetylglucosamine-6-phosphate deacetylase
MTRTDLDPLARSGDSSGQKRHVALHGVVACPAKILDPGWVVLNGSVVHSVGSGDPPPGAEVISLGSRLIAPGFVDLHVHGGMGAQVNTAAGTSADEAAARVASVARFHATHGTTALLATTVSDSTAALRASLAGIGRAVAAPGDGAAVLGAHLEGPWLAPQRAGAQERAQLRQPTPFELTSLLDAAGGALRLLTLAPELPGASDVIKAAVSAGIVVSIGHTEADATMARSAFATGASHVTHLFNAMPPLHHRDPGPIGAALADPGVTVEVIADGVHLDPSLLAALGHLVENRVVAVTDATSAAGQPDGVYRLGGQAVALRGHRVTLADDPDTIAGSALTMDAAVRQLRAAGWPLPAALAAATSTPARVAGAARKGRIAPGYDADLVVLKPDLTVAASVVGGVAVHDPGKLLGALGKVRSPATPCPPAAPRALR